jgi:hypothetical protein
VSLWAVCAATAILLPRGQPSAHSLTKPPGVPSDVFDEVAASTPSRAKTDVPVPPLPMRLGQYPRSTPALSTGPLINEGLRQNHPNTTEHVVAYGVLADGTEAFVYGPTETRGPAHSPQSGAESAPIHGQNAGGSPVHSGDLWRGSTYGSPRVAENGSYYGQISENTGRAK